jgi:hypothetical protein
MIKDGAPIAELLLRYYIEYDKLDKTNKEAYDQLIVEFLKDLINRNPPPTPQ